MAFWNRNKSVENSELPEEVREYYASTRKSRASSAWLLGFATLLLTLALAAALYFAGKFVYDEFFANDTVEAPTTSETTTEQPASNPNSSTTDNDNNQAPATLPGNDEAEERSPTSSQGTSSTNTGLTLTETPETGPGDTVAIFIGTTIIAALGYELYYKRKTTV